MEDVMYKKMTPEQRAVYDAALALPRDQGRVQEHVSIQHADGQKYQWTSGLAITFNQADPTAEDGTTVREYQDCTKSLMTANEAYEKRLKVQERLFLLEVERAILEKVEKINEVQI